MIIECQSCHARFRLDATKIRGKGARVRCRRCGDSIIVLLEGRKEEASPAAGAGGFLDLGSVVRDSLAEPPAGPAQGPATPPLDNLIPFPGPARAPEPPSPPHAEPPAAGEPFPFRVPPGRTEDVDLAFGRHLPEATESRPPGPPSRTPSEEVAAAEFSPPVEPPQERHAPPEPWTDDVPRGIASAGVAIEPGPEEAPELPPLEGHRSAAGLDAPSFPGEGGFLLSDSETLAFLNEGRRQEEQPAEDARTADISLLLSSVPVDETATSLRTPHPAGAPDAAVVADLPSRVEPAPPPAAPADMALEGNETPMALPPEVQVPPLREAAPPSPRPEARVPSRAESPAGRPASSTGRIAAAGLAVLLLGGVGYFGFTPAGRNTVETVAPGAAALLGGKPAATRGPAYDVRNVIGYYDTGAGGKRILVIKGQVANLSAKEKSGIRVFAAILDNDGKALAERAVYAGNVIPGETLRKIGPEGAEKILENRFGEGLANMNVGAGKSVPFMVVFFDAPESIDSYRLEARDAD